LPLRPDFATLLPHDRRCRATTLQHGTRGVCFFPDVGHSNDARRVPGSRGSRDVADFSSIERQGRFRLGHGVAGEEQFHASAVDLSTRAHPLDDFLPGVAALGVADVAVLQSGFVGDLFFAEVIAKPRHALGEPRPAQRRVSHRPAAVLSRRLRKNLPKPRQLSSFHDELRPGHASRRALYDSAGKRTNRAVVGGKVVKLGEVDPGKFLHNCSGLRTFQRQRAVARRLIRQRNVIHDDVFVEPLDQPLANHGVRNAKEPVRKRIRLDLGENVPLRIQQQRNVAVAYAKVFNVVRQDGVQVAHPVKPGERKVRAVVLVNQRHRLARVQILRRRIAKVIRHRAPKPNAHLRARRNVRGREQSVQSRATSFTVGCTQRSHFQAFAHPPVDSLAPALRRPRRIPSAILLFMSDGRTALNAATDGLIHITIPVGMLQCNCSIIGDPATREALVVDPGDEVTRILDLIGRHRLIVKAIVSTHAHIDHVGGLSKLHKYTGAPVLMHRDDLPLYQAMEMQAAFLGVLPPELTDIDQLLKEGDVLRWGRFEAQVIHTPGHTPGSVSLYLPHGAGKVTAAPVVHTVLNEAGEKITLSDLLKISAHADDAALDLLLDEAEKIVPPAPQLFSGDTLFAGSIGRTDLWGGSMEQIMDSLRAKLMHLPDDTVVHPGHGPVTTIGNERHLNPFLQPE
jgi:hydroxyacylglutathione hydrolase